ncbi:MAG: hypothetical protein WC657_06860 [Candidatus Paceibacterota bacterium]
MYEIWPESDAPYANEWARVRLADGRTAWIASYYGRETYLQLDSSDDCSLVQFGPGKDEPTSTPRPTDTPDATSAPTTPLPNVTPTPEQNITPAPTGEPKVCTVTLLESSMIRSGPGATYTAVGSATAGDPLDIQQVAVGGDYVWGQHARGWTALYTRSSQTWRVGVWGSEGETCLDVPGWTAAGLGVPGFVSTVNAVPKTGLHLIYGAQAGPVLAAVHRGAVGTVKGTTLTENIIKQVEAEAPDMVTVWRSTHTLLGAQDCPIFQGDPGDAATQWWSFQYISWQQAGLLGVVDFYEVVNECLGDQAWYTQFTLRLEELANNAGVCLLLFSDSPGNPAILTDWQARKPALDYALAHPCQSGRTHGVAQHVYGIQPGVVPTATGQWIFGRHNLILALMGSKYAALPWYFSEWGIGNGRGVVDCGALQADARKALSIYNNEPEVVGFAIWNVGGNPSSATDWTDITGCLSGL